MAFKANNCCENLNPLMLGRLVYSKYLAVNIDLVKCPNLENYCDHAASIVVDCMCVVCQEAWVASNGENTNNMGYEVVYDLAIEYVAEYLRQLYQDTHNLFGN